VSDGGKMAVEILTILPGVISFTQWCIQRGRERRARRRAGNPGVNPTNVREGIERGRELAGEVTRRARGLN
jgi:hypothetical protein